jgi:glucokinase
MVCLGTVTALAIALDIGGSGVRAAALDSGGNPIDVVRAQLAREWDLDTLWGAIVSCARAVLEGPAVDAVAASFPAFLGADGRVINIANLPALEGFDLAGCLSKELACASAIAIPDLAATVLAESRRGAGVGYRRVLATAIGTGVNAALAVDGQILDVAMGGLGDAGHVIVEADGERCPCGGRGCLESVCSGTALAAMADRQGWRDVRELAERLRAGDPIAERIIERAGRGLGRAIASWAVMLAPDIVTVGGSVSLIGAPLLQFATAEMRRIGAPHWVSRLRIVPARFPVDAALIGAGLVAHEQLVSRATAT